MKILVLGNDGRTHALVWKLFNSPQSDQIICAPGNGGTSQLAFQEDLDPENAAEVARWAFDENIDLIVPAGSEPLRTGLVDEVVAMHLGVYGPSQRSTRLEQSRCYAKEFLLRHKLPTARGRTFTNLATAEKYLASQPLPLVIKADNPNVGDGIFEDRYAALAALNELFTSRTVDGRNDGVVIEEFLMGARVTFSAFTDGRTALSLLPTRLYDRLHEDNQGPVAAGMGAYTSNSTYANKLTTYLNRHLMHPLVTALDQAGLPYWGILGLDCIITPQGPRITALRCSLRNMEAQVVLPRMEDDLLPIIQATITRRLSQIPALRWRDEASVGIGLVAQGYPHHFAVGGVIEGLSDVEAGVLIFHDQTHNPGGLCYTANRQRGTSPLSALIGGTGGRMAAMTTTGGHVLTVVALAATLYGARGRALLNAERITFPGRYYRTDIATREFA
ncbi:MAG: phosphoribosylamine--glycine ligase [Chloroflexaceae bacterium]